MNLFPANVCEVSYYKFTSIILSGTERNCSLCEDYVVTDKCGVGEKGIDGLIKESIARKDGKHELFRGQKKIVLHASCRKKYTRPQSITRDLKMAVLDGQPLTSSSTPCLRSSQLEFDFKSKCLCAVMVSVGAPLEEEFELDRAVEESNEI
ncbi:hypothetical protein AVEN_9074-1 [Araneus ventricosus]|uniref:Uncharacterized protein n=1 Tax=Araneus ventricosus TaxID=182803 RepID=A0A4Y2GAV2_ARAVE|nr:hypothetical protein AVEN_9074-1 [Araneus ventricosus]